MPQPEPESLKDQAFAALKQYLALTPTADVAAVQRLRAGLRRDLTTRTAERILQRLKIAYDVPAPPPPEAAREPQEQIAVPPTPLRQDDFDIESRYRMRLDADLARRKAREAWQAREAPVAQVPEVPRVVPAQPAQFLGATGWDQQARTPVPAQIDVAQAPFPMGAAGLPPVEDALTVDWKKVTKDPFEQPRPTMIGGPGYRSPLEKITQGLERARPSDDTLESLFSAGGEYLKAPWKLVTGSFPLADTLGQWVAEKVDPSVKDTRITFADQWDQPGRSPVWGEAALQHSRGLGYREAADEPRIGDVLGLTGQLPDILRNLTDNPAVGLIRRHFALSQEPTEEFPYGERARRQAQTIQGAASLVTPVDFPLVGRLARPFLEGLKRIPEGGKQALKVIQQMRAMLPRSSAAVPDEFMPGEMVQLLRMFEEVPGDKVRVDNRLRDLFGPEVDVAALSRKAETGDVDSLRMIESALDQVSGSSRAEFMRQGGMGKRAAGEIVAEPPRGGVGPRPVRGGPEPDVPSVPDTPSVSDTASRQVQQEVDTAIDEVAQKTPWGKVGKQWIKIVESATRGGAGTLTKQGVKAPAMLIKQVEDVSKALATTGPTGALKTDKEIVAGVERTMTIVSGILTRIGRGVIDQNKTVRQLAEFLDVSGTPLPIAETTRIAPLLESKSARQLATLRQKDVSPKAVAALKEITDSSIMGVAAKDPQGWALAEDLAAIQIEKALTRADFTPDTTTVILAALRGPRATAETKSLWLQYTNISYLRAAAKQTEAVIESILRRSEGEIPAQAVSQLKAVGLVFNDLNNNAMADVQRIANAIATTQRPTVQQGAKYGIGPYVRFPRGRATIRKSMTEVPEIPETKYYGEAKRLRSLLPQYAADPPTDVNRAALTVRNVLLEQIEYLRATSTLMSYANDTGMSQLELLLLLSGKLVGGLVGGAGGHELGRRYAEEEGLTGAAATGVKAAGTAGGIFVGTAAPTVLYGGLGLLKKGVPMNVKIDSFIMNNILSSPRSWFKAWEGAHFGALGAGFEKASHGLIEMGRAKAALAEAATPLKGIRTQKAAATRKANQKAFKVGKKNLLNGLGLMKDIGLEDLRFAQFWTKKSIVRQILGLDVTNPKDILELKKLLKMSDIAGALEVDRFSGTMTNSYIGRLMRAPDWGFQSLMRKRGFSLEEARRMTLGGQLRSDVGKFVYEKVLSPNLSRAKGQKVLQKGIMPALGRGALAVGNVGANILKRKLSATPRVLLQAAEMGVERLAGPPLKALEALTGVRAFPKSKLLHGPQLKGVPGSLAAARGLGALGVGYLGWEGQEHITPILGQYITPAMGPNALPGAAAAGARQAAMTGENILGGAFGAAMEEGSPVDLERPLGSMADPGSYARMFLPTLLRDVTAMYDPAPGRVTSGTALADRLQREQEDVSPQSPIGALMERVRTGSIPKTAVTPQISTEPLLGVLAEILKASPWRTGLPATSPLLNLFGESGFSPLPLPAWNPEPGGFQALPESVAGIEQAPPPGSFWGEKIPGRFPPQEQLAQLKAATQPNPLRTSLGEGLKSLAQNAIAQVAFPVRRSMKPANLTRMNSVLQAVKTYGDLVSPRGAPLNIWRSTGVSPTVRDVEGNPILNVSLPGQEMLLRHGAGETNRRLFEFFKFLMTTPAQEDSSLTIWDTLSPPERIEQVALFKEGHYAVDPRGPFGSPGRQRALAQRWQRPAR